MKNSQNVTQNWEEYGSVIQSYKSFLQWDKDNVTATVMDYDRCETNLKWYNEVKNDHLGHTFRISQGGPGNLGNVSMAVDQEGHRRGLPRT